MTRLGVAIDGARVLYRGLWPTYFTAPLAAAAIAARIWRLDEAQTAHALSLALMLSAGRSGRFQGKLPGRSVILAMAVTNGHARCRCGKRGRRRRSRPARRALAARCAGPRRQCRDAHARARRRQRLCATFAQAVLLGQAIDRCGRGADEPARRGAFAGRDHGGARARAAALCAHDRDEGGSRRTLLDLCQRRVPDGARRLSPRAAL